MEGNSDYLRRRAVEEQAAADHATSEKVRDLHLELAARYLRAADSGESVDEVPPNGNERPSVAPDDLRIID